DRRQFRAAAERDQDAEREAEREAEGREDQRHRQPAPTILGNEGEAEEAAPHQAADHDQGRGPQQEQLLAPEAAAARDHEQRDEDQHRKRRPPLLVERIGAEQDEAILLGDDGPAGADAAQRAACAGVAAGDDPDRIGDAPLPEADAGLAEQEQQQQGHDAGGDRGEQIGAQPGGEMSAERARGGTRADRQRILRDMGDRAHLSAPPARSARCT
ncbi:hypothetical protein chiPu_0031615, partial [Chiloscyllium punctatum]|nr:hypothetical protein [Chiloscyllium punctatum]